MILIQLVGAVDSFKWAYQSRVCRHGTLFQLTQKFQLIYDFSVLRYRWLNFGHVYFWNNKSLQAARSGPILFKEFIKTSGTSGCFMHVLKIYMYIYIYTRMCYARVWVVFREREDNSIHDCDVCHMSIN